MKKAIPNLITLLNALAGACAALCLFADAGYWALGFLALAAAADFLDGLVARLLRVSSPIGKQLDSLADMLSFGFIPGLIAYLLIDQSVPTDFYPLNWVALPGFLLTAFAALRLARFNLDERQTNDFIGLPTPSVTLFFAGLLFIDLANPFGLQELIRTPWLLYALVVLFSWLMIAELPMFSFKFHGRSWKGNEIRYIFGGIALGLLFVLREAAFSATILLYLLISGIRYFRNTSEPVSRNSRS